MILDYFYVYEEGGMLQLLADMVLIFKSSQ